MATDFRRKEQLSELTDRIVESYHEIPTINHLGHCPLPSADVMIEIVQDLKEVLFLAAEVGRHGRFRKRLGGEQRD